MYCGVAELAPLEEAEWTAQIEKLPDQARTAVRALLGNSADREAAGWGAPHDLWPRLPLRVRTVEEEEEEEEEEELI